MLVVSDIMTRSVLTLAPETPLREAAVTLSNMGVSGAPVCDEKGRLAGVFSKSDIAAKLGEETPAERLCVGELMTALVFSVHPGDALKKAISLMVFENVHRVMVVDDAGQLVGIVTPMDVCKAVASGRLKSADLEDAPR